MNKRNKLLIILTRVVRTSRDEFEKNWASLEGVNLNSSSYTNCDEDLIKRVTIDDILIHSSDYTLLVISGTSLISEEDVEIESILSLILKKVKDKIHFLNTEYLDSYILFHRVMGVPMDSILNAFSKIPLKAKSYSLELDMNMGSDFSQSFYVPIRNATKEILNNPITISSKENFDKFFLRIWDYCATSEKVNKKSFNEIFLESSWDKYCLFIGNRDSFKGNYPSHYADNFDSLSKLLKNWFSNDFFSSTNFKIIILCELEWGWQKEKMYISEFGGIEVAKKLRKEYNIDKPILFISSEKESNIHTVENSIVFTPGHSFISFKNLSPNEKLDINVIWETRQLKPIDELTLFDIKEHYCDTSGILRSLVHQLNNYKLIVSEQKGSKKLSTLLLNQWEDLNQSIIGYLNHLNGVTYSIKVASNTEDVEYIIKDIDVLYSKLQKAIQEDTNNYSFIHLIDERRNWNVLLLEDDIEDERISYLKEFLEKRKISVTLCTNVNDAEKLLQDYKYCENLRVVIADYRLKEPATFPEKLQPVQGYTFLERVSKRNDLAVEMIALSAMPRRFLISTFNKFGIKVELAPKIDYFVNKETIQILGSKIIKLGDECEEIISNYPAIASGWNKFMRDAYMGYRKHYLRNSIEDQIIQRTLVYIVYLEEPEKIKKFNNFSYEKAVIEGYSTLVPKDKKENYSYKFDEGGIEKFVQYFTARRLSIFLYLTSKLKKKLNSFPIETDNIHYDMAFFLLKREITSNAARTFFSQSLCLALGDLPFGMTLEEKRFFSYIKPLGIIDFIDNTLPLFNSAATLIEEYLKRYEIQLMKIREKDETKK